MSSLSLALPRVTKRTQVLFFAVLASAVLTGLFFLVPSASAGFIASAVGNIVEILIGFLGRVLTAEIGVLLAVTQYNDFVTSPPVTLGWTIVRDIVNMFFVLILLIIALATILHYEEYTYKKLLKDVILAALFVNFSKTIAGFFIDFAQVVMMTFVNGFAIAGGAGAGNFVELLQLREIMSLGESENQEISTTSLVTALLLGLLFILISVVVVGVMLAVFVFRILMLWALVVFSPLPWLLNTFPAGKKYAQQWWDQFTNFVVVGPVLAFFLWLSLATVAEREGQVGTAVVPKVPGQERQFESVAISEAGSFDSITSFVVGIGMLIMALVMAQQMGGVAGQLAGSALSKIQSAGFAALGAPLAPLKGIAGFGWEMGSTWGKRRLLEVSTREDKSRFNPLDHIPGIGTGWRRPLKYLTQEGREGFKKRGKRLLEDRQTIAAGQAEREANRLFAGLDIPVDQKAREDVIHKYQEEYKGMKMETFMAQFEKVRDMRGPEGELRREAILLAGASSGYLDDAMRQGKIGEDYIKLGKEKYGSEDDDLYSDELVSDFIYDFLTKSKAGEGRQKALDRPEEYRSAMFAMEALEDLGKSTYHMEYVGHSRHNVAKNRREATHMVMVGKNEDGEEVDGKGAAVDIEGNMLTRDGTITTDRTKTVDAERLQWDATKDKWVEAEVEKDEKGQDRKDEDGQLVFKRTRGGGFQGQEMGADFVKKTRRINAEAYQFASSELNKWTGRGKAQLAPHVLFKIRAVRDKDGKLARGKGGIIETTWGRQTEFNRRIFKGIRGRALTAIGEHGQQRTAIAAVGNIKEGDVEIHVQDKTALQKVIETYNVSPELEMTFGAQLKNITDVRDMKYLTVFNDEDKNHHSSMNNWQRSLEDEIQAEATRLRTTPMKAKKKIAEAEKAVDMMVETVGGGSIITRTPEQLQETAKKLADMIEQFWKDAGIVGKTKDDATEAAQKKLVKQPRQQQP